MRRNFCLVPLHRMLVHRMLVHRMLVHRMMVHGMGLLLVLRGIQT